MGSLIAAALARAQAFLLEPEAAPVSPAPVPAPIPSRRPLRVVVTGTCRRSGATTIARALAHALAVPGDRAAHLVSLRRESGRAPAAVQVWEVPPALASPREIADYGATLAYLAGGEAGAAIVWDVRADDVPSATRVMEDSDAVVCVADGTSEPALCTLVRDMLAERYGDVLLVANRVQDESGWAGRCEAVVPESRLAALLVARGRAPSGAVGEAVARVAALVEERG